MTVSVLICTYKRQDGLDRCLCSLLDESTELPDEIVIVDGEEGATRDIVSKWQEKFPAIKLIPTKNVNLAISRNTGLPHCIKDIIALTDDDVKVSPDWLKKIRQLHKEHPKVGVIGGRIESPEQKLRDKVANLVVFPFPDKPGYLQMVAGANASYKKEVIEKIGQYDESLFRGEDVDYNWRVLKIGYKIYYDPELIVYHYHRNTWRGFLSQIFMYGRGYYLVRRKWPDMYCIYPHGLKNTKNFLKLGYFFISTIAEPIFSLKKVKGFFDKVIIFPLLIICQIMWKAGMIMQKNVKT